MTVGIVVENNTRISGNYFNFTGTSDPRAQPTIYASFSSGSPDTIVNSGTIIQTYGRNVNFVGPGYTVNGFGGIFTNVASGFMQAGQHAPSVAFYLAGSYTTPIGIILGTVTNFGTISSSASAVGGKVDVINGSESNTTASLLGSVDVGGDVADITSVRNFGTINAGNSNNGVSAGGLGLTNGSLSDTRALVSGHNGFSGAGLVTNFGTIIGTVSQGVNGAHGVTNGVSGSNIGVITGSDSGVVTTGYTVRNFGTITGTNGSGVALSGTLINGAADWNSARVAGGQIGVRGAATIQNDGTIIGTGAASIGVYNSLYLLNGSAQDTRARVEGDATGVYSAGNGQITNFATIIATGTINAEGGTAGNNVAGIRVSHSNHTILNSGLIQATGGTSASGIRVEGYSEAEITNYAGGIIEGSGAGISQSHNSLLNAGTILGTGNESLGVLLTGGTLTNAVTGTISGGAFGVEDFGGGATIVNHGTISGTVGAATIGGYYGSLDLTTDGLITGATAALQFAHGNDTLRLLPGAAFQGAVNISQNNNETLHFASTGTSDTAGTIGGAAISLQNYSHVYVDAGANWVVTGSATVSADMVFAAGATLAATGSLQVSGNPSGPGLLNIGDHATVSFVRGAARSLSVGFLGQAGTLEIVDSGDFVSTIKGLRSGDVFDFTAIAHTGTMTVTVNASSQLVLVDGGTTLASLQLDPLQSFADATFTTASDGSQGTTITEVQVSCFYEGTLITTARGERPVETLHAGDLVRTADGRLEPIVWVGRQTVVAADNDPLRLMPIWISPGAIAGKAPVRPLLLSPDHAVAFDGILIQASALVNGTTIIRCRDVPETFTYFHIELASHELIMAEGLTVESFVDNLDRANFDNWPERCLMNEDLQEMVELDMPRAKSRRQVPRYIRQCLDPSVYSVHDVA